MAAKRICRVTIRLPCSPEQKHETRQITRRQL
jgi:hypothetical protein